MKAGFGKLACLLIAFVAMGMAVCAAETNNIDGLAKKNSVLQVNANVQLHEEPNESSAVTSALPAGTPAVIREDEKDGWCKVSYRESEGYVQTSVLGMLGSPINPDADNAQNIQEKADAAENGDTQKAENGENKSENKTENQSDNKMENESDNKSEGQSQTSVLPDVNVSGADASVADASGNIDALNSEFANIKEEGIQAYKEAENASAQLSSGIRWKVVIAVLVIAIFAAGIVSKLRENKGKIEKR